jgi:hypothetical protein
MQEGVEVERLVSSVVNPELSLDSTGFQFHSVEQREVKWPQFAMFF